MTEIEVRTHDDLCRLAEQLAGGPYVASPELPEVWRELSYDEYRKVVFDPNKAFWRSERSPFFLEAFHRGFVHRDRVKLYSNEGNRVYPIAFDASYFDYRGAIDGEALTPDFGFAGFRVVGKYPESVDWQEMLTFLGASYYRARAGIGVYGTSARGLAIDVGLNKPEEFPVFRSFWVEKPAENATKVRVHALLDSPSVVGAYRFVMEPGSKRTTLDVEATLFFRKRVDRLGIAPLTSMWMWGDGLKKPLEETRDEVHDADALIIRSRNDEDEDEWMCRSLMRQHYPSIVTYGPRRLIGFGLAQRDTEFQHYQDNEAKYHLRPSVWVEPATEWMGGSIQLLELPAEHEGIDNIAVWWTPPESVASQNRLSLGYRVTFVAGDPTDHSLLKLIAHRVERPGEEDRPMRFGLRFASSNVRVLDDLRRVVDLKTSGVRCEIVATSIDVRSDSEVDVVLDVRPTTKDEPFELKVQLFLQGRPLSETWSYLCPIQPPPVALPPWRKKT